MATLTLKWGNIKGWDGLKKGTPAWEAMEKYLASEQGLSAMQRQTTGQRELICSVIDAFDGKIWNEWDGVEMSKDDAKKYVRDYGE